MRDLTGSGPDILLKRIRRARGMDADWDVAPVSVEPAPDVMSVNGSRVSCDPAYARRGVTADFALSHLQNDSNPQVS